MENLLFGKRVVMRPLNIYTEMGSVQKQDIMTRKEI